MIKTFLSIIFFVVSVTGFAQYGAGINTETPDSSAELHVYSTNNNTGVLLPVMTEAEMTAINNPATGLLLYNSDRQKFMYNIGNAGSPIWTVVGELLQMDYTEIIALTSPPSGMLVYNTSTNTIWYYDGTDWQEIENM